MAGATPNGLPYPTGTDKVRDGDNAMEALARAIEAKYGAVQFGRVDMPVTGGNAALVFPRAYATSPALALFQGHVTSGPYSPLVCINGTIAGNPTATKADLWVMAIGAGTPTPWSGTLRLEYYLVGQYA